MTKEQAMLKIKLARTCGNFEESQQEISRIIDQIDQSGEFSVRELCELIGNVERIQHVAIANKGDCKIRFNNGRFTCVDADDLKTELLELAKPPEPKTIMVEMPLWVARCCVEYRDGEVAEACKAALEKAKL